MNRYILLINNIIMRCKNATKKTSRDLVNTKKGFGMNEILGIAAAIIIAAFVIIPGLRDFAGDVMAKLGGWWITVEDSVFLPVE